MSNQYLISKARNSRTGQTLKIQELTGARFTMAQRALCQEKADKLAEQMTAKTGDTWHGFVEAYTPSVRNDN